MLPPTGAPFARLIGFVMLAGFFSLGVALIVIGMVLRRKRSRSGELEP